MAATQATAQVTDQEEEKAIKAIKAEIVIYRLYLAQHGMEQVKIAFDKIDHSFQNCSKHEFTLFMKVFLGTPECKRFFLRYHANPTSEERIDEIYEFLSNLHKYEN